jgi:hypothetical protein
MEEELEKNLVLAGIPLMNPFLVILPPHGPS